jgi:hypothetical protein
MTTHATTTTLAAMRRPTKSLTRHLPAAARVLMGLVLLASGVFGLWTYRAAYRPLLVTRAAAGAE